MHTQRGNFLLQALLALTLIFAFVPFLARQLSDRATDTRMYTATSQVETAQTAARIFLRENISNLPYNTTVVGGDDFGDLLEPYGLPLGGSSRTALGQDMVLVIHKTPMATTAYLELNRGDLSDLEISELARRIGFSAMLSDDGIIQVGIDLQDIYSDVVRRNEPDLDNSGFLTDLDMGGFSFVGGGNIFAGRGEFEMAEFGTLTITGIESGRKVRSTIENMSSDKTVFQSKTGESALSLTRGVLHAGGVSAKTVAKYGDTGNLTVENASMYDFSMTAGRTSFTGPGTWDVRGSVVSDRINFSVERLDISSYLNATRGQDVYVDSDDLEYSSKSGLETDYIYTSNITMRDQTSAALNNGETGAVVLDIRPAGTSLLPDVWDATINNDAFAILENPSSDDASMVDCKSLITKYDGAYNKMSLSQYIICQYVYWQRLEKRIDIALCLQSGRGNCD